MAIKSKKKKITARKGPAPSGRLALCAKTASRPLAGQKLLENELPHDLSL